MTWVTNWVSCISCWRGKSVSQKGLPVGVHLEEQARTLVHSVQGRKWKELRELLQNTLEMRYPDGLQRKLIIFTQHRDTLNYLADRIRGLLGKHEAVVMIHGGVHREDRRKVQELFRNDKDTRVLLATNAAGEGVNLQNAHFMGNYDCLWWPGVRHLGRGL